MSQETSIIAKLLYLIKNMDTTFSPALFIGNITNKLNTIEVSGEKTGIRTGSKVKFSTTGTLPDPLDSDSFYYLKEVDNNVFQIFLDRNFSSVVSLNDSGVGTHKIITYYYMSTSEAATTYGHPAAHYASGYSLGKVNSSYAAQFLEYTSPTISWNFGSYYVRFKSDNFPTSEDDDRFMPDINSNTIYKAINLGYTGSIGSIALYNEDFDQYAQLSYSSAIVPVSADPFYFDETGIVYLPDALPIGQQVKFESDITVPGNFSTTTTYTITAANQGAGFYAFTSGGSDVVKTYGVAGSGHCYLLNQDNTFSASASSAIINCQRSNFYSGSIIRFMPLNNNSLPSPLNENSVYYVVNSTIDSFSVALEENGTPVIITDFNASEDYFVIELIYDPKNTKIKVSTEVNMSNVLQKEIQDCLNSLKDINDLLEQEL